MGDCEGPFGDRGRRNRGGPFGHRPRIVGRTEVRAAFGLQRTLEAERRDAVAPPAERHSYPFTVDALTLVAGRGAAILRTSIAGLPDTSWKCPSVDQYSKQPALGRLDRVRPD
jgi:hypothetical protein